MAASNRHLHTLVLPSLGYPYGNLLPEGVLPAGHIVTREEKILADTNKISVIMHTYIDCGTLLPQGLRPNKLITADRLYIFFMVRMLSYGNVYKFPFRCEVCGKECWGSVEIDKIPVRYLQNGESEPFSLSLPMCGKTIKYRFFRGEDEEAGDMYNEAKEAETQDVERKKKTRIRIYECSPRAFRFGRVITELDGMPLDTAKVSDFLKAQEFVEELSPMDTNALEEATGLTDPGLDLQQTFNCTHSGCFSRNTFTIPVTPEFFRPFR